MSVFGVLVAGGTFSGNQNLDHSPVTSTPFVANLDADLPVILCDFKYLTIFLPASGAIVSVFGSGFPFTQTQGYYEKYNFQQGIGTDYTAANGQLGIIYAQINRGRLPYYHRLDFSIKRKWVFREGSEFNLLFSITNVYNRSNIFYYDRIKGKRVDQLPILPALGCNYSF
jgi:hypothetical protein